MRFYSLHARLAASIDSGTDRRRRAAAAWKIDITPIDGAGTRAERYLSRHLGLYAIVTYHSRRFTQVRNAIGWETTNALIRRYRDGKAGL